MKIIGLDIAVDMTHLPVRLVLVLMCVALFSLLEVNE